MTGLRIAALVCLLSVPLMGQSLLDRGEPRVYSGEHLEAVGMPVGGIGTGNIWIAGSGDLSVWQIFNVLTDKARIPDSFLSVRVKPEGGEAALFALEAAEHEGFQAARVDTFQGDYPFAWLDFSHPDLPLEIRLEAFNPMVPLNVKDSSIPCAVFRLCARNSTDRPAEVSFAAALQNAVGYDGLKTIENRCFWGYGLNQNVLERGEGYTRFVMDVPDRSGFRLEEPLKLHYVGPPNRALASCENLVLNGIILTGPVSQPPALWIDGIHDAMTRILLVSLAHVSEHGGAVVLTRPSPSFAEQIERVLQGRLAEYTLFEDFESGGYEGWTVEGDAFADKPSTGTSPRQNPVAGYEGKALVNTYVPDDAPRGRLVSKPFIIRHRYIGFLVGGGAHAGKTCINLLVNGKAVRTTTGRDNEYLTPAQWDTADLEGKEATIEIVDQHSGGWGHINVDHIVFSDTSPNTFLGREEALGTIAAALPEGALDGEGWMEGGFGLGKILVSPEEAFDIPRALGFLAGANGNTLTGSGNGLPEQAPYFGSLCLAAYDEGATCTADWKGCDALATDLLDDGRLSGPEQSGPTPMGETVNCALAVPFTLEPGEERSVTFAVTWCFPNLERFGHKGNQYAALFPSAADAASYLGANLDGLEKATRLYRDTLYETNLPCWMVDCLSSQSCIFRTVNCFYAACHNGTGAPYFAGYEGCYGCCPLNCTHVWNYAQTHARLFPEIGQNLRWYDFNHYLKEDGETQHRQHHPTDAFIDGHCAVIAGAYREYCMCPDDTFLKEIWPGVRKATQWLIRKIDADENGVNTGAQWNTYDVATSGAHTFIGSQYLCALAAAEKMALVMGDGASAERWAEIRKKGGANQDRLLWNGEYYIQRPDVTPARDYNTGCHSDQLLGQWWAHMLDAGHLYPQEHVRTALSSIFKHNLREDFHGFHQRPRRYVVDDEGGLLMCTWPNGGRPDPFILYADEVWTGIEYSTAGLMIYEGMIEEAFKIVKTARDRYDGRLREGLNSGPGGNPFNELECGRFYARALSSWSLLLASQGFIHEGPAARIGFLPRWRPDDHKSFFCAAEGWGLFTQVLEDRGQKVILDVRYGRLPVREIVLSRRTEARALPGIQVTVGDEPVEEVHAEILEDRIVLSLKEKVVIPAGGRMIIDLMW